MLHLLIRSHQLTFNFADVIILVRENENWLTSECTPTKGPMVEKGNMNTKHMHQLNEVMIPFFQSCVSPRDYPALCHQGVP